MREYLDVADFTDALAAADLVVARAGGSVFELAAHGLPAVLVPYPRAAAGHQLENARWMSEGGAAVTIPDAELTGPRLRPRSWPCSQTGRAWPRWRPPQGASRPMPPGGGPRAPACGARMRAADRDPGAGADSTSSGSVGPV